MASVDAHQREPEYSEQPPLPPPEPAAPSVLDSHVNGNSMTQNAVPQDAFVPAAPAVENNGIANDLSTKPFPSTMSDIPSENVTNSIKPVAPLMNEAQPAVIPSPERTLPETTVDTVIPTVEQVNGHGSSIPHDIEEAAAPADKPEHVETMAADPSPNPASIANILNDGDEPIPTVESAHSEQDHVPQPVAPLAAESNSVPEMKHVDTEMIDVPPTIVKVAREREEDEDEEPSAKRTKVEESEPKPASERPQTPVQAPSDPIIDQDTTNQLSDPVPAPAPISDTPASDGPIAEQFPQIPTSDRPTLGSVMVTEPDAPLAAGRDEPAEIISARDENWGPMQDVQRRVMLDSLRNLKKGKWAGAFTKPVDWETLKIPSYPKVITKPMDLQTMEQKLKNQEYSSMRDIILDFELMINNCYFFNSRQHVVSRQAENLVMHFQSQLKKIPRAGESQPRPAAEPKPALSIEPPREIKRRASRPSLPSAVSPKNSPQTFALADGVPQIRRDSTTVDGRPKREIHRPAHRDLPYSSKPKKKKFQAELRFCSWVLDEMKLGRYAHLYTPFKEPVDPVALNIPTYRSVIKKPMDMQTVSDKLSQGHYESAKEFDVDMRLMFSNCYKFNPPTNGIYQLGKQYEAVYEDLMNKKQDWMAKNAPPSAPPTPEPGSESEAEEDEDDADDDEINNDPAAQLAAIHSQIQALTQQAAALHSQSSAKTKKAGPKKSSKSNRPSLSKQTSRKSGSFSGGPNLPLRTEKKASKPKPKAQKAKPLTLKEKGEIAEGIGLLDQAAMSQATSIITNDLQKHGQGDKIGADEYEIEDISEAGLHDLLALVRRSIGPRAEPEPSHASTAANRAAGTTRPKKNKPMNKSEQDARIDALHRKLGEFSGATSQDAGADDAEAESPDEYDSESEEE